MVHIISTMSNDTATLGLIDEGNGTDELTVSEIVSASSACLKNLWGDGVWVVGEVASLNTHQNSGHTYMTIKDSDAEVRCVLFRFQATKVDHFPDIGEKISIHAQPQLFEPKGSFQLIIKNIRPKGRGELHEQFIALKAKLRKEGWFEEERKKRLIAFPDSIAVVVSLQGAAWHDIRTTLDKRLPSILIKVVPAPAQGTDAAKKIADAVNYADSLGCDALLICRGGGSIEDLHAYNDILVAEAVFNAQTPVVSGVGHESDETIVDYIADKRAATPTAAAVEASPNREDLLLRCSEMQRRFDAAMSLLFASYHQRIDAEVSDLASSVQDTVSGTANRLFELGHRLRHRTDLLVRQHKMAMRECQSRLQAHLARIAGAKPAIVGKLRQLRSAAQRRFRRNYAVLNTLSVRINSLSPRRTLERGYAIVTDASSSIATSADHLRIKQPAVVVFADGSVEVQVTSEKLSLPSHLGKE